MGFPGGFFFLWGSSRYMRVRLYRRAGSVFALRCFGKDMWGSLYGLFRKFFFLRTFEVCAGASLPTSKKCVCSQVFREGHVGRPPRSSPV